MDSNLTTSRWMHRLARCLAPLLLGGSMAAAMAQSVNLADRPLFSTTGVPGNLMLALSVEWPTANTPAYLSTQSYSAAGAYLGYFDPAKCYRYNFVSAAPTTSYFAPTGAAVAGVCTSAAGAARWSGNYLNWAAMQSLDVFRWVLTGGDRVVDTTSDTQIEKTRHSGQGSREGLYPDKVLAAGVSGATPFTWPGVVSRVHGLGTAMYFSDKSHLNCSYSTNGSRASTLTCTTNLGSAMSCSTANNNPVNGGTANCTASGTNPTRSMACTVYRSGTGGNTYFYSCDATAGGVTQTCGSTATYASSAASTSCAPTQTVVDYDGSHAPAAGTYYRVYVRVRACDNNIGLEKNCTQYGTNYKPEGLMQQYAMQLRYGAFGYLNDGNVLRDGGVLRARMKSVGPLMPVPGSTSIANTTAEWSATTGVLSTNPDTTDASSTTADASAAGYSVTVTNSGVINYLNRFGKVTTNDYKSYDPVSEMYYAATRYFRNLGNVPSYTNLAGAGSQANLARWIDGFPVIRNWNDPVQYSCQKNFILGIGDVYTHRDKNVPGNGRTPNTDEPAVPAEVTADSTINAATATNMVGQLEGLANLGSFSSGRENSYYVAGLAYDAHTKDIRSDYAGSQTISTYWLDVRENQTYESRNQYWLAAKYGGFTVPSAFTTYNAANSTTTLTPAMWTTTGETVGSDPRPDNYFIASNPAALVSGLRGAFARIAAENSSATSTAFSTSTANITRTGTASYATTYDPRSWTGDLEASEFVTTNTGTTLVARWRAAALLDAVPQTNRKIVTCCTSANAALPFRFTDLNTNALSTRTYFSSFANVPGVDAASQSAANFVAYLRGDKTQAAYRSRTSVVGDIVGSRSNPVGKPAFPYTDQFNPGYGAFKTTYANRKSVVYVGSNNGMLHAFDGALSTATSPTPGAELFAFIPSFLYGDAATASTKGLAALGNPSYDHRYYVDATAQNFDVDFRNTPGSTATVPDWRTMLIGGLGKGGRGYYALDVTDPSAWTSETALASRFLWEFTDPRMGYSYAEPMVVKTAKYGWTVIFTSGYNNSDGVGYLFLVNPRTGALLEAIATPEGSTASPLNMVHGTAFVPTFRDFKADSVYVGDLRGNVWRFNLTAATGAYPAPTKIATLTDAGGAAQPITVRPLLAIDPQTRKRYVVIGTGRLLDETDITSSQQQTLYAIVDGTSTSGAFFTPATLPTSVSFPITRSQLNVNSDLVTGTGTATLPMGWYFDLAVPTSGGAERITVDMSSYLGTVSAGINLPNPQPCEPGGTGRLVSLRLADGKSVLVSVDIATGAQTPVGSAAVNGLINNLAVASIDGNIGLMAGTSGSGSGNGNTGNGNTGNGNTGNGNGNSGSGSYVCKVIGGEVTICPLNLDGMLLRRLNWREVQTSN